MPPMTSAIDFSALDRALGIDRPAGADIPSPLGSLILRPAVRSRNAVAFLSLRSWRADTKAMDLKALKEWKAARTPADITAASEEIASFVGELMGSWQGVVTNIACGHSRCAECWGKQLARETARQIGAPFVQLFEDRFISGSSHPKEFRRLGPLVWHEQPTAPVLIVDDLMTSGAHFEEALVLIRTTGQPAMAVAWIGGTLTA